MSLVAKRALPAPSTPTPSGIREVERDEHGWTISYRSGSPTERFQESRGTLWQRVGRRLRLGLRYFWVRKSDQL